MKVLWFELGNKQAENNKEKQLNFSINWGYDWLERKLSKPHFYEMYKHNPDIHSAIRKKALYLGKNWRYLKDKDWIEIAYQDNKEQYDRVRHFLNNPTWYSAKVEMLKHLDVCWELYLLPTTDLRGKEVNGFQVLHPKTIVKVIKDNRIVWYLQMSQGYSKRYASELTAKTNKDQLLKYYQLEKHIDNELDGMWLLEWVTYDVFWDLEAQKRNHAFFENSATPASVIITNENIRQDEIDILATQIKEKYQGSKNAHKTMLGTGVKDVKPIMSSPKDLDHLEQRRLTVEKVCSALGVPKSILNYTDDVNLATSLGQRKEFIEGTIANYNHLFEYILNNFLQEFWKDFEYEVCFNPIDANDEIEIQKMYIEELKNWGITLNEYRKLMDREEYEIEEADKPMVQRSMMLLEDSTLDPVLDTNNQ